MNDWINEADYKEMSNYWFNKAIEVIKEELPLMPRSTGVLSLDMKGCDAKCLEEITKILKAQKSIRLPLPVPLPVPVLLPVNDGFARRT
jgi:hypothetical protein